jgi:hypothetical protein
MLVLLGILEERGDLFVTQRELSDCLGLCRKVANVSNQLFDLRLISLCGYEEERTVRGFVSRAINADGGQRPIICFAAIFHAATVRCKKMPFNESTIVASCTVTGTARGITPHHNGDSCGRSELERDDVCRSLVNAGCRIFCDNRPRGAARGDARDPSRPATGDREARDEQRHKRCRSE